ncbi:replication initiation protein [Campylobacter sp. CNRCH_2014_0184h]|uniref:replication initiation protein n=1 Tax=Campylobacter sp. CNRCH_2014_0184h TaxID=2911602 RepID=UPI0021E67A62|nr:replication initiation protein [Campylobacter sp. CNRCH_2014_0184h]MCV3483450.1 replication initiation protein [Campylobacter sp. CNRCH_2014_0184h]
MSEIVKYHNDFNKIKLPSFTEQEQNLLCFLLTKIKEKKENEIFSIYPKDLMGFSEKNLSNREITEILNSFEEKFFKADFTIIVKDEVRNLIGKMRVNLFNHFVIWKETRTDWDMEIGDGLFWQEFTRIDIEVNKHFEYLVNQLTANFTSFELAEFIALSGKYTKTLYRLLKQYRTTGTAYFEWEEFCRIMDIPEKLAMCDIDKRILKPAIKELTKERTLFDQVRIPFKNLSFEKKKISARGRGGKVVGIEFTFKPENITIQKIENEAIKNASDEEKILMTCNKLCQSKIRFRYEEKIYQSNSFDFYDFTFNAAELQEDEFGNLIPRNTRIFKCKNEEDFFKLIKLFTSNIY